MKKGIKIAIIVAIVTMCAKISNAQSKVHYEKGVVWGQLNLTNTVGYKDSKGGENLYTVSIVHYDTIFAKRGNKVIIDSILASYRTVKLTEEHYNIMKASGKSYWVRARWVTRKSHLESDPPKNLKKPGKLICLIFEFGCYGPACNDNYDYEYEDYDEQTNTPVVNKNRNTTAPPCNRLCPTGQTLDPVTCGCY